MDNDAAAKSRGERGLVAVGVIFTQGRGRGFRYSVILGPDLEGIEWHSQDALSSAIA